MAGWTTRDIPDQAGRTVLVTGGNAGLGYQTAQELVRKGARVLLAARDRARGAAALERLGAEVPLSRTCRSPALGQAAPTWLPAGLAWRRGCSRSLPAMVRCPSCMRRLRRACTAGSTSGPAAQANGADASPSWWRSHRPRATTRPRPACGQYLRN